MIDNIDKSEPIELNLDKDKKESYTNSDSSVLGSVVETFGEAIFSLLECIDI
jgi:hypothetical protein